MFWRAASLTVLLAVFFVDRQISGGTQLQVLYAVAVALAMLSGAVFWVMAVAALAAGLVLLHVVQAPIAASAQDYPYAAAERLEALFAVVIVTAMALLALRLQRRERFALQRAVAAEAELRDKLHLLQVASEDGGVGGWTVSLAGRKVVWSDETARIHGMPEGFSPSFEDGIGYYAPDYQPRILEIFEACAVHGTPFDEELQIVTKGGSLLWVRAAGHAVHGPNGAVVGVQGALQDIHARKLAHQRALRLNRVYALLSQINAAMVGIHDRQQLFDTACRIAVESGGLRASWIGLIDAGNGQVQPVAKAGAIDGYLESIRVSALLDVEGRGPFGRAVRENRAVVCNDTARDPSFAPWRERALALGFLSVAVFPLRISGHVAGAVVFYADVVDFFDTQEISLFSDLADDISFASGNIARESVLRASEARFRAVFDQAPLGICLVSANNRFLRVNPGFCALLGYSEHELLEQHDCVETTHPDDREGDLQAVLALSEGQPQVTRDKRYLRQDGTVVWARLTLALFQGDEGLGAQYIGMAQDISGQRAIEERLQHSQALARMASGISRLGAWEVVLPECSVSWSDDLCRIADVPAGARVDLQHVLEWVDPPYREAVEANFRSCMTEGTAYDIEVHGTTVKNRPVWLRMIGEAVRDAQGRIVRVHGACQDISGQKQAEQEMVYMLRRFKELADAMPLIVWTADADGVVDFFTQAFGVYTGVPEGQMVGTGWFHKLHPDDKARCVQVWTECVRSRQPYAIEFRLCRHDGVYRWHLVRAVPAFDTQGEVIKWYGSATDIHDQKLLEQDARRLAQRLTNTLESITDAFFTVDRSWRINYLNKEAGRLLRRQPEQMVGHGIWETFPTSEGSLFKRECQRAMEQDVPIDLEDFYTEAQMLFEIRLFPSEEGLAIYFRDITAQRKADSQLRLLETAVARLNDIVLITEAEPFSEPGPRIVFANDAFERRTGYTRAEIVGRSPRILQGPGTSRAELDRIRAALEQWKPVRAELLNYTKAGEPFWIELDILPIADATGWFTHWVSVERDITERRALEEQLRQSQRLEAVGQLTGGMAHDFNNLLTVIMGNAEMLAEELPVDDGLRELAQMIGDAAQRGAELTQRMLAFARRQPLEPRPVNVNRLLAGMDGLLRRSLGGHIEIEFVCGAGVWQALVDPAQLESALLNLCLNSRDAMEQGGRLTIETNNAHIDQQYADRQLDLAPGQYVVVAVSDTGVGIAPELISRVVEPFFTTKEKGKGTGLGLSMVYGFAKQSRGHVSIYSEPGQGTTVKMYLPRVLAAEQLHDVSRPREALTAGSGTILLVEDDELVRRYAASQLVSLGYQVIEASDGPSALRIVEKDAGRRIDLLFTDVVMPGGMNGRVLADAVRALRPELPVLFTSGYTENAIVHHGRLDAGVQLLGKPYRRAELARRVSQMLGRS